MPAWEPYRRRDWRRPLRGAGPVFGHRRHGRQLSAVPLFRGAEPRSLASGGLAVFARRGTSLAMRRGHGARVSAMLPLSVLPLSDDVRARRFPIVNVALIVANFAV